MNDLLERYIELHTTPQPELLARLDRATNTRLVNGRMCSGHLQGRLLKMLVAMARPKRVLELGTFSGYSALCIAEALDSDAELHTVEIDDELEPFISHWLQLSPHAGKVKLHIGDAIATTRSFPREWFDMVFMDSDKRDYPRLYREVMERLRPGGFILADNTLWDGHVVESGIHAPQTAAIMEFNDIVAADPTVEQVIVPLRDGLTIIRKNPLPLSGINESPSGGVL